MRATSVLATGSWQGTPADHVLLDWDRRFRRRIALTTQSGASVLLDLPQAARLRAGDALVLEDGNLIEVVAKPEPLAEIHAHDDGALVRIAWHLGNRHLPVQLMDDGEHLRIRRDHVIEAMVEGLGGHVELIDAPFDPEAGAYAGGHHHHHDDDDDHDHGHDHGHDPAAPHSHGHHHN
jgi:urease accessory protein